MVTQVFVPSLYGSILLDRSIDMTRTIYLSNWIERNRKYKQAMQIFTVRTFKPMTIYAGGVFLLSLPTFVSVSIVASKSIFLSARIYFSFEYLLMIDLSNRLLAVCPIETHRKRLKCVD